jgi:AbiV family abortive infection protein
MADIAPDVKPHSLTAMDACVAHGKDLLASAKAVQAAGHPNIAYHLAALCLEEVGRRSLLGVQSIAEKATVPPAWPKKHEQDHVKNLFWAIFGPMFLGTPLTAERIQEMNGLATHIHETRLLGLYVGTDDEGITIPGEQIGADQAQRLIDFAEARLGLASAETFRDEMPEEFVELQAWLLTSFEDPEKRKTILSRGSLDKLAEFNDVRAWVRWLKDLFDQAEADGRAAARREIERSNQAPDEKTKDKWQTRVRIIGASHSIRPKALSAWNKASKWIKLSAGGHRKELLIDIILGNNVPVQALWYFGWGVARQFVAALNMGTMGFWWWHMPQHVDRWFESLRDLESGQELKLERKPSLVIDWGANRVLSEQDLGRVAAIFASLTSREPNGKQGALDYYIGGLTFLALNDVHWQCEGQSFGNFFESLRHMMAKNRDWAEGQPFVPAFLKFIDTLFPNFDEKDRYVALITAFETKKFDGATVTLKEVSFIKLFCDAYYINRLQPKRLAELEAEVKLAEPEPAEPTAAVEPYDRK